MIQHVSIQPKPYLFLLLGLLTGACISTEREAPDASVRGSVVHFHAGEIPTKTVFGDPVDNRYPTLWTAESVSIALGYSAPDEAQVTPSEDGRSADFAWAPDLSSESAPYVFRALSPASAVVSLSPSRQAWSVYVPSDQTPLPGSPDESAMLVAATSESFTTLPENVSLAFSHVTAYGRLSFQNLDLGEATPTAIEITSTAPLCGAWYFDGTTWTQNGSSSTLTLHTSRTDNVWFACAPVNLSGEILVFTIRTDQGNVTKEVLVADKQLLAGKCAHIVIDMDGETIGGDGFTLVKNASTLAVGDEVVIVYASGGKIMGSQGDNYRNQLDVTIEGEAIPVLPDGAAVLTLGAGKSVGTWSLKASDGYLAAQNGRKNYLKTVSSVDEYGSWTISITNQDATIQAKAGERNMILYNSSSPRFSCYASVSSATKSVQLYRRGGGGTAEVEDPLCQQSQYGLYLGTKERVYTPGEDQYSREYGSIYCFTILSPAEQEQLEISGYRSTLVKGDPVSVSVRWRKGVTKVLEGTYEMKVVREDGPKVWLGNGSGQGFIIKK